MSALDTIVSARIHPAIGIARVGNSRNGWFAGPEVLEPSWWSRPWSAPPLRDGHGALNRQAARFRIYGYDADKRVVAELTLADAKIAWEVDVANTKASWYQFQVAMDIPEASGIPAGQGDPIDASKRRNNNHVADRGSLEIRPGPHRISVPRQVVPMAGHFLGTKVELGELRMKANGQLLVLGGRGRSGGKANLNARGNADGWYDDLSDGPVRARVRLRAGGRAIPVEPAWVVVAPPNFAPALRSVRTMNDLVEDVAIREKGMAPPPASFEAHVRPILKRMSGLQWVNVGFARDFGHGGREFDAEDEAWIASFDAVDEDGLERRKALVQRFRRPEATAPQPQAWPPLFGDAFDMVSPRQGSTLTRTQLDRLDRWARGDFSRDPSAPPAPGTLAEVPLQEQPGMLDRAALDACTADAFHPGSELGWPMRHGSLYSAPYRIRGTEHGTPGPTPTGEVLTPEEAKCKDGPLGVQRAGDLTRWMGLPWQADLPLCRDSGAYPMSYQPCPDWYLPTFWPVRAPNHVLSEDDFDAFLAAAPDERQHFFNRRRQWLRTAGGGGFAEQTHTVMHHFSDLGVVVPRDNRVDSRFPRVMHVEVRGVPTDFPTPRQSEGPGNGPETLLDAPLDLAALPGPRPGGDAGGDGG